MIYFIATCYLWCYQLPSLSFLFLARATDKPRVHFNLAKLISWPKSVHLSRYSETVFLLYKLFSFSFFWLCHAACGILVPLPGIEPAPPAVEAWSLNHWTAREVPLGKLFKIHFLPFFENYNAISSSPDFWCFAGLHSFSKILTLTSCTIIMSIFLFPRIFKV